MEQFECFSLVCKKSHRRSGTAVLIFPGLIPTYSDLDKEAAMFAHFGDVLAFHYPETPIDAIQFYQQTTSAIQRLGYKKLILVGMSFGGTLGYLLLRYWRQHRLRLGVKCLVTLSTPFQPENLTPISQFQLDLGVTVDRYARKVFIVIVRILRGLWRFSTGMAARYAHDSSFHQMLSAVWMGTRALEKDWLVKKKFGQMPALLLNVRDGVRDHLVSQTNELDFADIFPQGKVMRVLERHADINGAPPAAYRQVEQFIEAALRS